MNLFLSGVVEEILDAQTREIKYPHLSVDKLIKWMDKYGFVWTLPDFLADSKM